jgi:Ataxin-3
MLVYWEEQIAGLCAVHAVNSLLQSRVFGPEDLAEIAHGLDAVERAATGGTQGANGTGSFNVDGAGNYSVQVISSALSRFDLTLTSLDHPRLASRRADPTLEDGIPAETPEEQQQGQQAADPPAKNTCDAYVCWLMDHWFSIRRIADPATGRRHWFNLNSLNKPQDGPTILSNFYHQAFFDSLRDKGYSIFAVEGDLPPVVPLSGYERDWRNVVVPGGGDSGHALGGGSGAGAGGGDDDPELQRVLEESMMAAAMEASLAAGAGPSDPTPAQGNQESGSALNESVESHDDAEELAAALAFSMTGQSGPGASPAAEQQPAASPPVPSGPETQIQVRLADGGVLKRGFVVSQTIGDIRRWIDGEAPGAPYDLRSTFPVAVFSENSQTLEAAGLLNAGKRCPTMLPPYSCSLNPFFFFFGF